MASDCWCNTIPAIAGLVGGGIVAYATHWLAAGRERENREHADKAAKQARKNVLLGFLNVWEAEVEANRPATSIHNVRVSTAEQFDQRRLTLIEKAAPVEFDFAGDKRTEFKGLVAAITSMTPGSVGGDPGRQKLLQAIRDLLSFLQRE